MIFKNPELFWKNFNLGTELQISGSFIYNALYHLDKMKNFRYEEDCFEFLYNISVGIERLQKITIILFEHENTTIENQKLFEKSLITHNHVELQNRISKHQEINFGSVHHRFIELIAEFYKSTRYQRFNLDSVNNPSQDKERLIKFLDTELKFGDLDKTYIKVDERIKKFIGNIVKKISLPLYSVIKDQAHRIGTFTYELSYESKAFKIFICEEFSFSNERRLQKEILIHLLNLKDDDHLITFIKRIKPLGFESYNTKSYINYLLGDFISSSILDEVEQLDEVNKFDKDRLEAVNFIDDYEYFIEPDEVN